MQHRSQELSCFQFEQRLRGENEHGSEHQDNERQITEAEREGDVLLQPCSALLLPEKILFDLKFPSRLELSERVEIRVAHHRRAAENEIARAKRIHASFVFDVNDVVDRDGLQIEVRLLRFRYYAVFLLPKDGDLAHVEHLLADLLANVMPA